MSLPDKLELRPIKSLGDGKYFEVDLPMGTTVIGIKEDSISMRYNATHDYDGGGIHTIWKSLSKDEIESSEIYKTFEELVKDVDKNQIKTRALIEIENKEEWY